MKSLNSPHFTMQLMGLLLLLGLGLLTGGLYLIWFKAAASTAGPGGITTAVILISLGLLLLVPAKLYIILQLMQKKRTRKNPSLGS